MGTKPSMQIVANIHEIVLLTPFGMRYTFPGNSSPSSQGANASSGRMTGMRW